MKYNYSNEVIPQDQRSDINTKIEYIVNNDLPESETGISKEDIFNAYTGVGGLHGLQFSNYSNYYDYQKAKAEIEQGQFFTPYKLVEWIYNCLHISNNDLVADLTCGHGAFASCCPVESNFQTCRAACPPYVVPSFRHKQCMNPASLQFRLSLSRAILSMRATVHYRARRGEWRKTILSRKLICAVILFKHKQLRLRVRTLII